MQRMQALDDKIGRARAVAGAVARRDRTLLWRVADRWGAQPDPRTFTRLAFRILLDREPDPGGFRTYVDHLVQGTRTHASMTEEMIGSDEFWFDRALSYTEPVFSLHRSRCLFVQTFPRADRILDLGGTHQQHEEGALVRLGYPYRFERLVIVDLPAEERHDLYRASGDQLRVETSKGPAEYSYHSMADLSRFPDGSFDLVYSGQSIEHVPTDVAEAVLVEVHRVLAPGGWLCLDTPNGRLCRLQLTGTGLTVTNPDHDAEYDHETMAAMLRAAGFEIEEERGLVLMEESRRTGRFSFEELATGTGVYREIEDCYLLAYVCRRPA